MCGRCGLRFTIVRPDGSVAGGEFSEVTVSVSHNLALFSTKASDADHICNKRGQAGFSASCW